MTDASLLARAAEVSQWHKENRLYSYAPYAKQIEFHNAGKQYRERLFMAGNQLGKTLCMGNEVAMHITGEYPDWWQGKRIKEPNNWWVAGVSGESTRDNPQRILLGPVGALGTGTIPKDLILDVKKARGMADAVDTALIRHKRGTSIIQFKSYEKGREKWQGMTLNGGIWFDEEPPIEVYMEGLVRTNRYKAMVAITATPLLGMSEVINRFIQEENANRKFIQMTIYEVGHYSKEEIEAQEKQYRPHERKARLLGEPLLGSGQVYPLDAELIAEPALKEIPDHWPQIVGLDIGWDHPTAAVWLAWDRDHDVIHVTHCYKQQEQTPIIHAAAIRAREPWIPVAWPHDALQHDKGSGVQIAQLYRDQGLKMLSEKASYPDDRGHGVEAGVWDILQRMQTGRFKVAEHLHEWFAEYRLYHRKDGKIVALNDDIMSATRYATMMLRFGKPREYVKQSEERYSIKRLLGRTWLSA